MNARDDMSDTDVLTAVRDCVSGTPLAGPPDPETIMARGRARRRRRLIPGVTGTLAAAAGVALAVTLLAPASHQPPPVATASHRASRQPAARLAAWTVTKLADGNISVTVRELKNPAALQGTLRADGVPASVTFASQQNAACRPYPGGAPAPVQAPPAGAPAVTSVLRRVFPEPYQRLSRLPSHLRRNKGMSLAHGGPPAPPSPSPDRTVIVIDPSALPHNAGVRLGVSASGHALLLPQVVYASPRCTGS
jgi:hypothetical protein